MVSSPLLPVLSYKMFVCIKLYLCQQFFSHDEMEPMLPGYLPVLWGVDMSGSRTQHCASLGLNPGPLDLESDAIPPGLEPRTSGFGI